MAKASTYKMGVEVEARTLSIEQVALAIYSRLVVEAPNVSGRNHALRAFEAADAFYDVARERAK